MNSSLYLRRARFQLLLLSQRPQKVGGPVFGLVSLLPHTFVGVTAVAWTS